MDNIETIYQAAFDNYLKNNGDRGHLVVNKTKHKVYSDTGAGKFYLCGGASIHYSCRNAAGRKLHKYLKSTGYAPGKSYYGGFDVALNSSRGHGNGMFEPMVEGYSAVADYLNGAGFECNISTRLD